MIAEFLDILVKIEQNKNIFLQVRLESGGCFTQPVFSCALGFVHQKLFAIGPSLAGSERILVFAFMSIDPTTLMHHLERFDLTDAQKIALIHNVECLAECVFDWLEEDDSAMSLLEQLQAGDSVTTEKQIKLAQPKILNLFERAAEDRSAESD